MAKHCLRFQCSIPASLTRTPEQALAKTIEAACEHLVALVPGSRARQFSPIYEERKTRMGMMWDVLVVFRFELDGPLPPIVQAKKQHAEINQQLRRGRGN